MKRVANTYSPRTISAIAYAPASGARVLWWIPQMPSYVWLAMIVLSISALSISTMIRSRDQENEARASYSYLKLRVENAKGVNRQFKDQTAQIKNNPRAAAQAAQDQLRLIRPNEVVVAAP